MLKRAWLPSLFVISVLLAVACASAGSGGVRDPSVYRHEIGRVAYADIIAGVERVLMKHNYAVRRFEENYQTVYFETEWQPREPEPAEVDQGLERARIRILIRGRRGAADLFRVEFSGESEGLMAGSSEWQKVDVTDETEQGFRRITGDLEMEMRVGIITR